MNRVVCLVIFKILLSNNENVDEKKQNRLQSLLQVNLRWNLEMLTKRADIQTFGFKTRTSKKASGQFELGLGIKFYPDCHNGLVFPILFNLRNKSDLYP